MALTTFATDYLVPLIKEGSRIASFGYPDIVSSEKDVLMWLGKRECAYREDAETICKWHGLNPQRIPDAASFFEAFGATLDVFDIVQARGNEILCDLNEPMDAMYAQRYDFVLDVGTIEHCFNIGQAAKNMGALLNRNGIIIHGNPMVMGNHGFYGLNPTWFADFYGQPGFELLWCKLMEKGGTEAFNVPYTKRFIYDVAKEVNIFAAAKRTAILPIAWPTQTKYAALVAAGKPGVGERNG